MSTPEPEAGWGAGLVVMVDVRPYVLMVTPQDGFLCDVKGKFVWRRGNE